MKKVNQFEEVIIYRWQCPECSAYNDESSEPVTEDIFVCSSCGESIEVGEDDEA